MPTGLRMPVGVSKSGGAAVETNESNQTTKMLFLAFSEGEDNNPFQNLGIGGDLIFSIRNAAFRGRAQRAVERVIQRFSDRIALSPSQPIRFTQTVENEVEISFEYVDLLTNKVEEFRSKFNR